MIEIIVHGEPAPQGSKRYVGRHGGRGLMIESSAKVKPWREAVKWAAIEAMRAQGITEPLDGPLCVQMVFTLRKPASAPKRTRTFPDRKPDLSKLVRSTEDALTDAGLIVDDARIVSLLAFKLFPDVDDADVLAAPGAVIRLSRIEA